MNRPEYAVPECGKTAFAACQVARAIDHASVFGIDLGRALTAVAVATLAMQRLSVSVYRS